MSACSCLQCLSVRAEDAMRFQVEAVAHELRNPGWFKTWLARKGTSGKAADGARVKPPMTPWMAFVHVSPLPCTGIDNALAFQEDFGM